MSNFSLHEHLEKLIHFESAARLEKISAAAKALRSSPAAISRSIKILEDHLNQPLIVRKQNGIELTDGGQTLYEFSRRLLQDVNQVEERIRKPNHQGQTLLRVGTHETLAIYFWPRILRSFFDAHPDIRISLTSGRVEQLVAGLRQHHYDLIVSVSPSNMSGIENRTLYQTHLGLFSEKRLNTKPPILN